MVNAINGAENGDSYWLESQHYWKAKSYIVENLDPKNQKMFTIGTSPSFPLLRLRLHQGDKCDMKADVGVDGEGFPCESFHVEVHPGMAHVMSMDGKFFVSDFIKKHDTNEGKLRGG